MTKQDTAADDWTLALGKPLQRVLDAGHLGPFAVESEPGRSIVLSHGRYSTRPTGERVFMARSRLMLDARDIPALVNALAEAAENANRGVR
jgi:hypothetical protein